MKKEYIEYPEYEDDRYGKDSDGVEMELLDEVEDIENEESDPDQVDDFDSADEESYEEIQKRQNLNAYLDNMLKTPECFRKSLEFVYNGITYTGVVMGKSKNTNRYVFKIIPGDKMMGVWSNKIQIA